MGHFYDTDGTPRYFVKGKNGAERATTIADARANGWLPSVTEIIKIMEKPALTRWKQTQAVLAVCTAPDVPGEDLGAKIVRILDQEQQQDEEARIARDRGTAIHSGLEALTAGKREAVPAEIMPWIEPAWASLEIEKNKLIPLASEAVLVGEGYAGRADLIGEVDGTADIIVDFKSAKTLPGKGKGSYQDHLLQLSAYAAAYKRQQVFERPIMVANVYISTLEMGKFVTCISADWEPAYAAFAHLVKLWQWFNNYTPPTQ